MEFGLDLMDKKEQSWALEKEKLQIKLGLQYTE